MKVSIIQTEDQYGEALSRMEALWGAPVGSPEGDELDLVMLVVEAYEKKRFPIPPPDPIEAIKFRMQQMGLKNDAALAELLGLTRARVSELLNRRRGLTLSHVRLLHRIGIPADVLIAEYELGRPGGFRDQQSEG